MRLVTHRLYINRTIEVAFAEVNELLQTAFIGDPGEVRGPLRLAPVRMPRRDGLQNRDPTSPETSV